MRLKDAHTAYIPTRDEIGTFDVDPVTKKAGLFVTRTDEVLLAASAWVLRTSAGAVVENQPPVLRWLKKVLRIRTTAQAKRSVKFHDGALIEFTVRVVDGGKA
jgi:hypothetical protein